MARLQSLGKLFLQEYHQSGHFQTVYDSIVKIKTYEAINKL